MTLISICARPTSLIYNYVMGNIPLTRTKQTCDLGIEVTNNLDWSNHIAKIVSKANRCLWSVIRALGYNAPICAKKIAYLSLVRPILEYGTTIWNPCSKSLMEKVEKIQRRATSFITNNKHRLNPGYKNYKTRLKELNLLPTSYRREMADITMLLKSLNTDNGFDLSSYIKFSQPGEGRNTRAQVHGLYIKPQRFNYLSTSYQYIRRTIGTWNALPHDTQQKLRDCTKPEIIKNILNPFYINLRDNFFDHENTCTWVLNCKCPRCRP